MNTIVIGIAGGTGSGKVHWQINFWKIWRRRGQHFKT